MSIVEVPPSQKQKKTKAVKKERPKNSIEIDHCVYQFVIDYIAFVDPELASKIEIDRKISQVTLYQVIIHGAKKERNEEDPKRGFVLRGNILVFFTNIFEKFSSENPSISREEIFTTQFIPYDGNLIYGLIDYCFSDITFKRNGLRYNLNPFHLPENIPIFPISLSSKV